MNMKKIHQLFVRSLKENNKYNKRFFKPFPNFFNDNNNYHDIWWKCYKGFLLKKDWEMFCTNLFMANVTESALITYFKRHRKYNEFITHRKSKNRNISIKDYVIKKLNYHNSPHEAVNEPYTLFKGVISFPKRISSFERNWSCFVSEQLKMCEDI